MPSRRRLLRTGGALLAVTVLPVRAAIPETGQIGRAIESTFGDRTIARDGISIDLPPLAENGNSVALGLQVDSPMTPTDHVRTVHVFSDANPLPVIGIFRFSRQSGAARVDTRIRLADSQRVVAVAEHADGHLTSGSAEIIVTLAACITLN